RAVDVGRPRRERLPCQCAEQRALPEGPVHDHRDTAIARERQDALLDFAIHRVVGDLEEIDRLAPHQLLDIAMAAAFRCRNADVTDLSGGLHREQGWQMFLPCEQIVNLHEIESAYLPFLARSLDLLASSCARRGPDLVRGEDALRQRGL